MCFDLHQNLIICHLTQGNHAEAEKFFELTLKNARGIYDKYPLYIQKIDFYMQQFNIREALKSGLDALKLFKINIPMKPSKLQLFWERMKLEMRLARGLKKLENLPDLKDPQGMAICSIFSPLLLPALPSGSAISQYIILKHLNLSLSYGIGPHSALAFVSYALFLASQKVQAYHKAIDFSLLYEKFED